MPLLARFDLPKHDVYVSGRELMTRGVGNDAQLGLHGPMVAAGCLAQGLPDPLREAHPLPSGNVLDLLVLFLI